MALPTTDRGAAQCENEKALSHLGVGHWVLGDGFLRVPAHRTLAETNGAPWSYVDPGLHGCILPLGQKGNTQEDHQ